MSRCRPTDLLLVGLLGAGPVLAGAPDRIDECVRARDGLVTCEAWTALSVPQLRAVVDDPEWLTPGVLEVTHAPRGRCEVVTVLTEGLWRPLSYTAQRCPIDDGWRETLVSSPDFDGYFAEWHLVPEGEGTRVTFQVRLDIKLPVPDRLVDNGLMSSTRDTVVLLLAEARER